MADGGTFTITLLSDTLVRDDNGQHTLNLEPALKRRFDSHTEGKLYTFTLNEQKTFRKPVIVGGFNRKWGLPLPQVTAIAAGSVFTFEASPKLEDEVLRALEETGVGERRLDGFGRIAIDWYSTPPERWVRDNASHGQSEVAATGIASDELCDKERKLGELMLRRLLRRRLDRALQEAIHILKVDGTPPNSQLARWRSVIYNALSEPDADRSLSRVSEFLKRESGQRKDDPTRKEGRSSTGWEKLHRARIGSGTDQRRMTEWIKEVLTDKHSPWKWLKLNSSDLRCAFEHEVKAESGANVTRASDTEPIEVEADFQTAVEYRLRLIDGVLARAAKENVTTRRGGFNG